MHVLVVRHCSNPDVPVLNNINRVSTNYYSCIEI